MIPQSALPLEQDQEPNFGLTSPVLNKLIGSLPLVLEDCRYFLNALDEYAANKDDKLLMFRVETLEEKWPEVIEHRNVSIKSDEPCKVCKFSPPALLTTGHKTLTFFFFTRTLW